MNAVLLSVGLLALSAVSESGRSEPDLRCGSYCLFMAMHAFEPAGLSFSEIERELGQPSPNGYSLGDLAATAEKHGFNCLGVVTTIDRLLARSRPFACIARIDEAHFVVLADASDGKVNIFDPPHQYELPIDTLQSRWNGTALLISPNPLIPEEEVRLTHSASRTTWAIIFGGVGVATVIAIHYWRRR